MNQEQIIDLLKTLEAGSQNAAPSTLTQGAALQRENLSNVMEMVVWDDSELQLQQKIGKKAHKNTLYQFNRQLSYGEFGNSAQYERGVGEESTLDVVRCTVPMAYYSMTRSVSVAAQHVQTFDGTSADDLSSKSAASNLAGDIEFDLFRGQADFSNGGVFDGNPLAIAEVPNMRGLDSQIREADVSSNATDLMFAEYGSDQSVIVAVNGVLSQTSIEDSGVKSRMNGGKANTLLTDPIALSKYNKIAFAKERIMLAGSAQANTGADLRNQWTSVGGISLVPSRFLSAKTKPARSSANAPAAPTAGTAVAADAASVLAAGTYIYYVTARSERGESLKSANYSQAVAAGERVDLTINTVSGAKYFNVYRTTAGGAASTAKFIGRIKNSGAATTVFVDLGNRNPGSITCFLIQPDTHEIAELAPFSSMDLAISALAIPRAYYQFTCVAARGPKKNVLLDNVSASIS